MSNSLLLLNHQRGRHMDKFAICVDKIYNILCGKSIYSLYVSFIPVSTHVNFFALFFINFLLSTFVVVKI